MTSSDEFWQDPVLLDLIETARRNAKLLRDEGKFADRVECIKILRLMKEIERHMPANDEHRNCIEGISKALQKIVSINPFPEIECENLESSECSPSISRISLPSTDRIPPDDVTSPAKDDFDTFASARTKAIEDTIVTNVNSFPSFNEIAGLEEAKNAMIEALVDPINYPDYFKSGDLKPWKSVLLYGPPGTGKTILSQAIVKEINGVLYQISSSDLISAWQGQSEKLIKELFDHAFKQEKTVVIFIDEIDSLCRMRSRNEDDANRRVKTEILVQIQRLQSKAGVILICATNCPWELDPAFLRRLEKRIYAGLPDIDARREILKKKLKNTTFAADMSVNYLAEYTNGFSGDDLRRLTAELAYAQFRKFKNTRKRPSTPLPLTSEDVHQVLETFQPSIDRQHLENYEQFRNKR